MQIDVAYVGPEDEVLVTLTLAAGATVGDAVDASGIVARLGLFEAALGYGIHGQRARRDTPLVAGDRVELLRPLLVDPKEARRLRALARPVSARPSAKDTRRVEGSVGDSDKSPDASRTRSPRRG